MTRPQELDVSEATAKRLSMSKSKSEMAGYRVFEKVTVCCRQRLVGKWAG
ncbi:MAG: hypothetical protein V2I56_11695 [Desulfobacteraceae bacterium]|jgi:hypothetical protein|nr:hypothetical protein [Desulfobacteraceae bacterium]